MLSILLVVLSGVLMFLSQPPFNLGHLCWFVLVPFLIAINGKKPKQGFVYGFIMGLVYFLCMLYFIFTVMPPVTILAGLILIPYQALFFALFGLLFTFILGEKPGALKFIFFSAFLWVAIEYIRSLGIFGFPWGMLAYAQWKNLMLIQISDITGVYGVSFVIFIFNAAVAYIIMQYRRPFDPKRLSNPQVAVSGLILFSVLIFIFFYGMKAITKYAPLVEPDAEKMDIAIVQGNIDQWRKWDAGYLDENINRHIVLSGVFTARPDLIVWPETVITANFEDNPLIKKIVSEFVRKNAIYLLTGAEGKEGNKYYNRAVLFNPNGDIAAKYDKRHLVPFGEATPSFFKSIFPFIKILVPGEDFSSGKEYTIFDHPKSKFACCICFESIFPNQVRKFVKNGARVLVNITNDAWFGKSNAPYHHFTINSFRAVENRIEIARAANTGVSGFIDKLGRPRYYTKIYTPAAIRSRVSLRTETTFYTQFGDIFSFVCIAMTLFALFSVVLKGNRKS